MKLKKDLSSLIAIIPCLAVAACTTFTHPSVKLITHNPVPHLVDQPIPHGQGRVIRNPICLGNMCIPGFVLHVLWSMGMFPGVFRNDGWYDTEDVFVYGLWAVGL